MTNKSSVNPLKRKTVDPNFTNDYKRDSKRQSFYASQPQNRESIPKRLNEALDSYNQDFLVLAKWLSRLGELEKSEVDLRNKMWMNKNFNIEYAFKLLNPVNGVITLENLYSALTTNLDIEVNDKTMMNDIINRLAYIKPNKLVLSDMTFFEPTVNDESYKFYKANYDRIQNTRDMSWVQTYKELWEAMLETVRQRRAIQNIMVTTHPNAVDNLYKDYNLRKLHK